MAQPGLDRLRVDAGRDQQADTGVPQVVEPYARRSGKIQVALEGAVDGVGIQRAPSARPKDVVWSLVGLIRVTTGQDKVAISGNPAPV